MRSNLECSESRKQGEDCHYANWGRVLLAENFGQNRYESAGRDSYGNVEIVRDCSRCSLDSDCVVAEGRVCWCLNRQVQVHVAEEG